MLRALGGHAAPTADGCVVDGPQRLHGGFIDTRGDHRMLMAAAVAGLAAGGAPDLSDPRGFPGFFPSFLGGMRAPRAPPPGGGVTPSAPGTRRPISGPAQGPFYAA